MYTTYPQPQNYGPQHTGYGYAPMPQPMPQCRWPPRSRSSSTNNGLLMVAGLAVVGAAAFGGVYLMNTSSRRRADRGLAHPRRSSTSPPTIEIPSLTTDSGRPGLPGHRQQPGPGARVHPRRRARSNAPVPRSQTPLQRRPGRRATGSADTKPTTEAGQDRRHAEGRAQEGRAQEGRSPRRTEPKTDEHQAGDAEEAARAGKTGRRRRTPKPATVAAADDMIDYGEHVCRNIPHKPFPSFSPGHLPAWAECVESSLPAP